MDTLPITKKPSLSSQLLRKSSIRFLKRSETESFLEKLPQSPTADFIATTLSVRERSQLQTQRLQEYLQEIKFFAELDPDSLRKCITHVFYMEFKGGDFVFYQGEEGTRFYVVLAGSVAVLKENRRRDGKLEYTQLGVLKAGSGFGELALINDQVRTASILCREPTYLAVLERDEYKRILGRMDDAKLEAKVQLLQKHPGLTNWGRAALQRVSYFFTERSYKWKQVLYRAGQDCSHVFFIKSGEFRLSSDKAHSHRTAKWSTLMPLRQQLEVTLVSAGEVLGDIEALEGTGYQYTCSCYTAQGEVMQITREDFLKRLANETSMESFKRLNTIKAQARKERLEKASSLETFLTPPSRTFHSQDSLSEELSEGKRSANALNTARKQLTTAVKKRWGCQLRPNSFHHFNAQLTHYSMSHDSLPDSDRPVSQSQPCQSPTSWVSLVERKYFSKSNSKAVFFHKLQEPEDNISPRNGRVKRGSVGALANVVY